MSNPGAMLKKSLLSLEKSLTDTFKTDYIFTNSFVFKKDRISSHLLLQIDKECAYLVIKTNSLSKDNQQLSFTIIILVKILKWLVNIHFSGNFSELSRAPRLTSILSMVNN